MRGGPLLVGIVILVLALLLLFFGTQTRTIDVPETQTKVLFDRSTFTVGDSTYRTSELTTNLTVLCSGSVMIPSTNNSGDLDFYVMNKANFLKWQAGERSVDLIVQKLTVSQIELSFVTPREDTYYFVFDNTHSTLFKKEIIFSASYQYTTIQHKTIEDRTLNSYGYPLVVVGAVVTIYGLVRKSEVTWA
jgi:hypothetical protein